MFKRVMVWGLIAVSAVLAGCSDNDRPSPCPTCPERDPVAAAVETYLEQNGESMGLRPGLDELVVFQVSQDLHGDTHVRMNQYYRDVRVEYYQIVVHLDEALEVTGVSGGVGTDIDLSVRPRLAQQEAEDVASEDMKAEGYRVDVDKPTELIILRREDEDHLCWRVGLRAMFKLAAYDYYVSAINGDIVYRVNKIIASS